MKHADHPEKARLEGLVRQIRALMTQNGKLETYFRNELEWLDSRESLWRDNAFRVGLLGVTSSGKSTLVNALLEARLLPDAVRPSSNCLVVCEWGEVTEAVVRFQDSARKPEVFRGSGISAGLATFADEKTNPRNREGVREICVRSPLFRFGRGVSLVDTPGLDAYGHDEHEALTLEVLLPTVDVVLFLTTCKANSDAKLKEYVCLARDHGKPVIVVQNMADSVVERLGAHGQVIESRNQVLEKHLHRVLSVVKRAGVDAVSVSQVSAHWALRGRLPESGLPELVAGVRQQLEALVPTIMAGRLAQLRRWLAKIVRDAGASDPAQQEAHHRAELVQIEAQLAGMERRYAEFDAALQRALRAACCEGEALRAAAAKLTCRDVDRAYALKTGAEKWLRASPAALITLNREFVAAVGQDCEALNLRPDDIELGRTPVRANPGLQVETTEKTIKRRVEQSGAWGWLKRKADIFNNDWGVNEHYECRTEIADLEDFRARVAAATLREEEQVETYVVQAQQRTQDVRQQFHAELARQQAAIRTKMAAAADTAMHNAVARQLAALQLGPAASAAAAEAPVTAGLRLVEEVSETEVEPAIASLARLAALLARQRFLDLRNRLLDRWHASAPEGVRVLILGFDRDSLDDFLRRFWFDLIEPKGGAGVGFVSLQIGQDGVDELGVACLDGCDAASRRAVAQFMAEPCVLFALVNIQQIGSSENLLHRSGIVLGGLACPTIVVVQSIRELENSSTIADALYELHRVVARSGALPAGVIVNDEEVFHSTLAGWLLGTAGQLRTVVDETELLASIPLRFRSTANKILRDWKALAA